MQPMLGRLQGELRRSYDAEATTDRRAVADSIRGAMHSAPERRPLARNLSSMSDRDFVDELDRRWGIGASTRLS
jgi:hypothetical protein